MKKNNLSVNKARKSKYDEFYTRMEDIEKELIHYKQHFKDKIIYCNCDDFEFSNFWKYFKTNFDYLGLKKLIATCYKNDSVTYKVELFKDTEDNLKFIKTPLKENGDFRSEECVEILKEADIVVTNPPFSLLREYIVQLYKYDKKFIIVGQINSFCCKEIFPLLKDDKIWLGYNKKGMKFKVTEDFPNISKCTVGKDGNWYFGMGMVRWMTNLSYKKEDVKSYFHKTYKEENYVFYDNYNALEVSKVKDIPVDYYGVMGVPISFLDKYDCEEFEILGSTGSKEISGIPFTSKDNYAEINGKRIYARLFIRRKK